jgi:hypothetical protein
MERKALSKKGTKPKKFDFSAIASSCVDEQPQQPVVEEEGGGGEDEKPMDDQSEMPNAAENDGNSSKQQQQQIVTMAANANSNGNARPLLNCRNVLATFFQWRVGAAGNAAAAAQRHPNQPQQQQPW